MPVRKWQQQLSATLTSYAIGDRNLDVIYQNTTGRPLVVMVGTDFLCGAINDSAYVTAQVENVTPPTASCGQTGVSASPIAALRLFNMVVFVVPAGYYYRVARTTVGTGVINRISWNELTLIESLVSG